MSAEQQQLINDTFAWDVESQLSFFDEQFSRTAVVPDEHQSSTTFAGNMQDLQFTLDTDTVGVPSFTDFIPCWGEQEIEINMDIIDEILSQPEADATYTSNPSDFLNVPIPARALTTPQAASSYGSSSSFSYTSSNMTTSSNGLMFNSTPTSPIAPSIFESPYISTLSPAGISSIASTAPPTRDSSPVPQKSACPTTTNNNMYSLALTSMAALLPEHIKERRYGDVYLKLCEGSSSSSSGSSGRGSSVRAAPYPSSSPSTPSSPAGSLHRGNSHGAGSATKFFCPVTHCNRSYERSGGDKEGFRTDNLGYHLRAVHNMPLGKKERALKWLSRLEFD